MKLGRPDKEVSISRRGGVTGQTRWNALTDNTKFGAKAECT